MYASEKKNTSSNDEKSGIVDHRENVRGIDMELGCVTKRNIQETNRIENKEEYNRR